MSEAIEQVELFAWVGPDDGFPEESRTEEIGIKQGKTNAGFIPLVSTRQEKLERPELQEPMKLMADLTGRPRMLCRFVFAEVIETIEPDPELKSPIPTWVEGPGELELP